MPRRHRHATADCGPTCRMPLTSSRASWRWARSPSGRPRNSPSGGTTATSSWRMLFLRRSRTRRRRIATAPMHGGFQGLQFECHGVAPGHIEWRSEINPHPAKALDIHHFSPAIRDLMFVDAIGEFLGLIFEAKTFASQTLGFPARIGAGGTSGFSLCALYHPAPVRRHLGGTGGRDDRRRRTVLLSRQPPLRDFITRTTTRACTKRAG